MKLLEHRLPIVMPSTPGWQAYRDSLSAELASHRYGTVFMIVQGNSLLCDSELCRNFGENLAVCSDRTWENVALLHIRDPSVRLVDKSRMKFLSMGLRIQPAVGQVAIDLQLSNNLSWFLQHIQEVVPSRSSYISLYS